MRRRPARCQRRPGAKEERKPIVKDDKETKEGRRAPRADDLGETEMRRQSKKAKQSYGR